MAAPCEALADCYARRGEIEYVFGQLISTGWLRVSLMTLTGSLYLYIKPRINFCFQDPLFLRRHASLLIRLYL